MKYSFLFSASFFLSMSIAQASVIPRHSTYDVRVQSINYNSGDVPQIFAKTGYVTVINFSKEETIVAIAIGFSEGWEAKDNNNSIFIKPVAYTSQGQNQQGSIEPTVGQWNTNMIVTTNKHIYSFDLKLVANDANSNAYVVNFHYPTEELQSKTDNEKKNIEEQHKKVINAKLDETTVPKNWNFAMVIGKDSQTITPDFVYDDGVRTYFGFSQNKSIPAVFYYSGKQEMMSNTSQKQQDTYSVLIVHKVADRFILRSGKQVIGILNHGYGSYIPIDDTTTNSTVIRVVKGK